MENKKITTQELVFNKFIKPLIIGLEECQGVLNDQQKNNLGITKNTYLQTYLASHIFEIIGKIYIAFTQLNKLNKNIDIDNAVSILFQEMKKGSHKLDILYTPEMKEIFGIECIEHIKSDSFPFMWGKELEFNCDYYQVSFIGKDIIDICHTENARYGIFGNGFPEIFIANQFDVNLKLGMMVGVLKDTCNHELLLK